MYWTSYGATTVGVRPCEVLNKSTNRWLVSFGAHTLWLHKRYVFETADEALADARDRHRRDCRGRIKYWLQQRRKEIKLVGEAK